MSSADGCPEPQPADRSATEPVAGAADHHAPVVVGPPADDSRRRAMGAAVGLAIVVATYTPAGLGDSGRQWAAGAVLVGGVVLADALPDVRRLLPNPGLAPLSLVAALVVMYLCVPETNQVPVALLLPVAVVLMELATRRQAGIEWFAVAAAVVGWAGIFGSAGRQSAIVGALFAWWPVLLLPVVHYLTPVRSTGRAAVVAGIGAVAAGVVARTGGIADTGPPAWLAVAIATPVSLGLGYLVARR